MRARLMIENPAEVEATIKLTMTLREWEELRGQLEGKWPSSHLSQHISDLLAQGRRVFWSDAEEQSNG